MPAPLVVGGRAEPARRNGLQLDPFQKTVKGKIEIEPGLFAVGNDVQARVQLIVNRNRDRILDQFLAVRFPELVQVLAGELQPAGQRIAADHRGA